MRGELLLTTLLFACASSGVFCPHLLSQLMQVRTLQQGGLHTPSWHPLGACSARLALEAFRLPHPEHAALLFSAFCLEGCQKGVVPLFFCLGQGCFFKGDCRAMGPNVSCTVCLNCLEVCTDPLAHTWEKPVIVLLPYCKTNTLNRTFSSLIFHHDDALSTEAASSALDVSSEPLKPL